MNKIRTFLCLLILLPFSLFATERLEWSDDENVFEYKVDVKNKATGEVKSYTTQQNYIDIAEQSGEYEFRVKPVDMLGREGNASTWQGFKISKALTPVLTTMPPATWKLPETSGELATIPVNIQNVSPRTSVQFVNQETKQVVEGQLVIQSAGAGGVAKATGIKVPQLESGEWKIKVTDPSGHSAETGVIKIESQKEERLKKEALAKAEAEKTAAREAELAAAKEAEALAKAEAEAAAGAGEAAGAEGNLAEDIASVADSSDKIFASNAQKIRIEKQIAKRVRGYQKKIR